VLAVYVFNLSEKGDFVELKEKLSAIIAEMDRIDIRSNYAAWSAAQRKLVEAAAPLHPKYDALQKHAVEHYNQDGWDVIVECVGFDDFIYDLVTCRENMLDKPYEDILAFYTTVAHLHNQRRKEIQSEIF
jgi:hypothetical protein